MSRRQSIESKVLHSILNLVQTNKGSYTTVHVKKVKRIWKDNNVPSTLVGRSLAKLREEGILKPRTIGSRRIYIVDVHKLVEKMAKQKR